IIDEMHLEDIDLAQLTAASDGVPKSPSMFIENIRLVRTWSARRNIGKTCEKVISAIGNGSEGPIPMAELEKAIGRIREIDGAGPQVEFFDSRESLTQISEAEFVIDGFLQANAVNAIAGLAGSAKTWIALDIASKLLIGPGKLWDTFAVRERTQKVIYLVPECSRSAFKPRLHRMNLIGEVGKRFFVRTMNMGPAPALTDSRLLREVEDAHVICDTAIRFMQQVKDEADAIAAQVLSDHFFALLRAGAKSILALFHSPKALSNGKCTMTLENMIRGSGEFGAALGAAWGVRQIDAAMNIVHIENLKARDFEPCEPFELQGRPYIDEKGGFLLLHPPGECSKLQKLGRVNEERTESKHDRVKIVRAWLHEDPALSSREIVERFRQMGVKVELNTVNKYRGRAQKTTD